LFVFHYLIGTGLYDNLQKYNLRRPEDIFDIHYYRHSPQAFVTLAHELWPGFKHSPTLTHSFLKLLSDKGLLLRNYTQNIDGLDHLAGVPGDKLLECHGHFRTASCVDCKKSAPILTVQQAMVERNEVPKCDSCGGNVKPDIVFFGEQLPSRFYQLFQDDIRKADCLLILGTSLQVAPVSAIPQMVCCPRVLFNREYVLQPTSSGHGSKKKKNSRGGKQQPPQDIYVEGDCDATVLELSEILGWDEELKKQHAKTQLVRPKAGGGGGSSSSSSSPTKAATKKNIDECNAKKKTSR